MKKGIYLLVLCLLVTAVVGCGAKQAAPTPTPESTPTELPEVVDVTPTEEPTDAPVVEPTEEPTAAPTEVPADATAAPSEAPAEPSPTPAGKPAAMSASDLTITIGGKAYKLNDSISGILGALGSGYEYGETISCDHEGMDKIYTYADVELYTYPDGNVDKINEIVFITAKYKTDRGIGVSDSTSAILAAYGDGYEDLDGIWAYKFGSGALWFYLRGDTVRSIGISQ